MLDLYEKGKNQAAGLTTEEITSSLFFLSFFPFFFFLSFSWEDYFPLDLVCTCHTQTRRERERRIIDKEYKSWIINWGSKLFLGVAFF